ncbi:MAG: GerAB/ArcD/ProY family transporter [Bacillota bacterium]
MLEKGKIAANQVLYLAFIYSSSISLAFVPKVLAQVAQQDALVSLTIAVFGGIIIGLINIQLLNRFPGKSIIEISELCLGRFGGAVVGLALAWFFLHIGAISLRIFTDFMMDAIMPETPPVVFALAIVGLAAYAVNNRLEVIGRTADFIFPLYLGLMLFIAPAVLLSEGAKELHNFQPFLENPNGILLGGFMTLGWFGDIVLFGMIAPYLNRPKRSYRSVVGGLAAGSLVVYMLLGTSILVIGPSITAIATYPSYNLVTTISVGVILDRLDVGLVSLWTLGVYIRIALSLYAFVLAIAQIAKLKTFVPLIIPAGILMVALSFYLFRNTTELIDFSTMTLTPYSLPIEMGIPVLLLMVSCIRGKRLR